MKNRRDRAAILLRVSTDGKGQDEKLQQTDLEGVCEQRDWPIVKTYAIQESAFGKSPRKQFQAMLEDARKGDS